MASKTYDDLSWRQKRRRMAEVERCRVADNRDESTISKSSSSSSPRGQILSHSHDEPDSSESNDEAQDTAVRGDRDVDGNRLNVSSDVIEGNEEVHDHDDKMNVSYKSDSNDFDNDETKAGVDECEQGRDAIRNLSSSSNLSHVQIKNLLGTLRASPFNLLYLPKDPITLLQTQTIDVRNIVRNRAGGRYLHFGFKNLLIKKLENLPDNLLPQIAEIDFSTDGGKVSNAYLLQFWPIQFRVVNDSSDKPLIAGCFLVENKSNNAFEFMVQFVEEVEEVIEDGGVKVRDKLVPIQIRYFFADAPARAFVLNHFGHISYHSCSKCIVEGRPSVVPNFERTIVFLGKITKNVPMTITGTFVSFAI